MNDKDSKLISEAYKKVNEAKAELEDWDAPGWDWDPKADYEKQKKALGPHLNNPKIQELADKLHAVLCDSEHTERCAYHYGSWKKGDIRTEMMDYVGYVIKLLQKYSYGEVEKMINTMTEAKDIKKKLQSMLFNYGFGDE